MPGGFSASSKLLQKKWEEKKYQKHREKMQGMKSEISEYNNPNYDHLVLRVKKVQKEEERQARIDHENQLLIQRMTRIMRSRGAIDNWNDYETRRSMNLHRRSKEQERIAEQNVEFARRLEKVKSRYDTQDWEDDYQRHHYYLDMWANSTKDYTLSPRSKRLDGDRRKSHSSVTISQDYYDSDFEDPEDSTSDQEKLPKLESRGSSNKENSHGRNRKKESSVSKLPDIKNKNEQNTATESDAKLLFKATKKMANPDEIILKTLIKKSHAQRMATKDKFEDMYDHSLEEKLKNLGAEYEPLVECLLAERESRDSEAVNTFIHNNDVQSLINMFCFRNQSAINSINRSYQDKFEVSIREDIEHRILDEDCQTLLLALLNCDKSTGDVDEDQAKRDAQELFQADHGRFTDPDGTLLELFKSRPLPHIKAVLNNFKKVSGGEDVSQCMKNDGCSKAYINALMTITKCMNNGATLNAEKMHALIKSGKKKELISLLLARAEIDMADIRKAYKKKYGHELIDDIMSHCGNIAPLIAHIAAKPGKATSSKEQGKGQGKDGKGQTHGKDAKGKGQVTAPPPGRKSPAKRPEPKKDDNMKNSPLARQNKQSPQKKDQGKGDEKSTTGTIKGPKKFDAADDAEKIHKAVKGFGTDEQPLIDILAFRTNAQRQQIKKKYQEKYDKDLVDVMKSELTGDFEEVTLALLMTPVEYDAYCLHDAMHGPGTKEAALIGIICTRTGKELKSIKAEYKKVYKTALEDDLRGDTSGDFEEMLLELIKGEREQGDTVDKKQAEMDAKKLYKSEDNMLDVESDVFKDLICKKNKAQIRATFEQYKRISDQTIEDGIEQAWVNLGDSADGYSGLAEAIQDTVAFYASRLQDAMDRSGTNDTQLIRIIVSRSEIDLADIKAKFKEITAKSLERSIEDETSGDYKKMLLTIVKDK